MAFCESESLTRCTGYNGDYDTYLCDRNCMRLNSERQQESESNES